MDIKTSDLIKRVRLCAARGSCKSCKFADADMSGHCIDKLLTAAAERLEKQKAQIAAMKKAVKEPTNGL